MNNNSKVLALKYRPQNFDDLIGQEIVTETIKNSIKANKIPNAYLFTGIRGVGKTTIARVVAKSINCINALDNKCKNKCENCDAIANSSHIDVLEIDAASHTSVNDIREISILNVELADSVASITVHFHTIQTRIARDEHGDITDDSDTEPREFIDVWTFERDLTLADPNWKLAETESADDDS